MKEDKGIPGYDHFLELVLKEVDKGIEGINTGIPLPLKRLETFINGIQKQFYVLIGGASGTGKTAIADLLYAMGPYLWIKAQEKLPEDKRSKIKLKVLYRSMERSKKYKIQKWTCIYLYLKHRITIDVPTLNGWSSKLFDITPEIREKITSASKFINDMLNSGIVEIHDGAENPTGIMKDVFTYANSVGKLETVKRISKEGNEYSEKVYTPHDPDLYTIIIEDHLGKLKLERGFDLKKTIDKMSEYNGLFRDIFGFTVVAISQFNRSLSDSTRMKNKVLAPEPSDFKESSNTYEDADLVLALFNPYKLKISTDLGYDVPSFVTSKRYNRYRSLWVLKNSFGIDDVGMGLLFRGEMGLWEELPKPEDKADLEKIYEKLKRE